ncbi:MAG: hypothetical protein M3O78_06470 [Chloroflexota bacterium]|nr:hypothetical protein [Chloroflexota bacterium]
MAERAPPGAKSVQRREAGEKRASQGDHEHEDLGAVRDGGQGATAPTVCVEGLDRIGWQIRARGAARVADLPKALGKPGVPAAPFQGGIQDFDCSHEWRQVHG